MVLPSLIANLKVGNRRWVNVVAVTNLDRLDRRHGLRQCAACKQRDYCALLESATSSRAGNAPGVIGRRREVGRGQESGCRVAGGRRRKRGRIALPSWPTALRPWLTGARDGGGSRFRTGSGMQNCTQSQKNKSDDNPEMRLVPGARLREMRMLECSAMKDGKQRSSAVNREDRVGSKANGPQIGTNQW